MRRLIVIGLLLICTFSPVIDNSRAQNADGQDGLEISFNENYIIHRGETIEATITIKNTFTQTVVVDFSAYLPDNITISNLPSQFSLSSDQIRQFRFSYTCDNTAPYGPLVTYVNITSDNEIGRVYSNEFTLSVSKQSDLRFGVDEDSQFVVDPGLRTNLAVNMTNHGMFDDDVTFSITTTSPWQWGWIMNDTENGKALESFQSSELKFIRLWIEIPFVIDSLPLYLTGPRFTLTAQSSLDLATVSWSFDLLMSEFRNVTLLSQETNLPIDPDTSDRIPVTIRNSGNVENLFALELQILDQFGNVVDSEPAADRIQYDGWTIAIFGGYEDQLLMPKSSRTFELAFQSPSTNTGQVSIRLSIIPSGAQDRSIQLDMSSNIQWNRNFSTEQITGQCTILPEESCAPEFRIYNNGNYQDQFIVKAIQIPEFVELQLEQTSLEIPKGGYTDITSFTITAKANTQAFSNGQIIFEIGLVNSLAEPQEIAVAIVISPQINWSIQTLNEEVDALGRFNIAMTLLNDGNAADGIIVQLQCSHFTPISLVAPTGAITEPNVESPRSFEINNIGYGSNFTVRAWAVIPSDQNSNGTMYLNVSIRSSFAPDEPITFSTNIDYLGTPWQVEDKSDEDGGWSEVFSNSIEIIDSWKWIIISIILSTLIISKAFKDRHIRKQNDKLYLQLSNPPKQEHEDDWMSKFNRKDDEVKVIESPKISPQSFARTFNKKSAGQKPVLSPVDESLRNAASIVLDSHDKTVVVKEADELLEAINVDGIKTPSKENTKLPTTEYNPNMTQRNDPQNLLNTKTNQQDYTKSIPLPDNDDLDF